MSAEPKFVSAGGLRFAYLESQGPGDDPPLVVLVHGFPDTAYTWDEVRPALAEAGFRVVAPFTRGYAPTEVPADGRYDSDTLGRDVLALIEALGAEHAIVVGHDWGASAAYSAVGLEPKRIALLVTTAVPHPAALLPTPGLLWKVRHFFSLSLPGAAARVRRGDFAHVDELVRRWSPTWDVPAGETDAVKRVFSEPGCLDAALGYYRALRPWLPASQRRPVEVPTVSFAGEDDIIAPAAFDRAAGRFKAGYEVVRMPGGHFMHREHPERFIGELTRALKRGS